MNVLSAGRPLLWLMVEVRMLHTAAGARTPWEPDGVPGMYRSEASGPDRVPPLSQSPAGLIDDFLGRNSSQIHVHAGPAGPGPTSAIALKASGGQQLAHGTGEPFLFITYAMAKLFLTGWKAHHAAASTTSIMKAVACTSGVLTVQYAYGRAVEEGVKMVAEATHNANAYFLCSRCIMECSINWNGFDGMVKKMGQGNPETFVGMCFQAALPAKCALPARVCASIFAKSKSKFEREDDIDKGMTADEAAELAMLPMAIATGFLGLEGLHEAVENGELAASKGFETAAKGLHHLCR